VIVPPGRHVLLANALGVHASIADATYSGGLAATGGSIVLRPIGGTPLDAVGWGDAVNGFVEGSAAPAPPAGRSIERVADTNDNAADFVLNPAPVAQGLTWEPEPTPTPTTAPTAEPTLAPTPTPTPSPAPTPTPALTPALTPTPSPEPTLNPTPAPTAPPTPGPTVAPTETPLPVTPIAEVRLLADGSQVVVEGAVTLALGAIDGARGGFIQDATGGIGVYLDASPPELLPAGARIRATGSVDSRYAQRVLRIAIADVTVIDAVDLPPAVPVVTGEAGEPNEGLRLEVTGAVIEAPSSFADGLGLLVDDGTGAVRVIVGAEALAGQGVRKGDLVIAAGPLGQRDSSGTGTSGYRLYSMLPGELAVVASPTPSPSSTASPTPAPSASPAASPTPSPTLAPTSPPAPTLTPMPTPTPTLTPTPAPTPTPTPTTTPLTVGAARQVAVGGTVTVRGVVTAEAGRLGTPPLLAIGDATGGLPVKLADGMSAPARGTLVELRGTIHDPYGQTELRLADGGLVVVGVGPVPTPIAIAAGDPDESLEGRLAVVGGTITTGVTKATSGDMTFTIEGSDGAPLRIMADASAGLDSSILQKGAVVSLTGIIGQRASRKGAPDGYRLWVRDRADVVVTSRPTAAPTPTPSPAPGASASPGPVPLLSIAKARLRQGDQVTVEGVVTIARTLLDASGRRTIVQDGTAAVELYLASADPAISPGARVRATGTMGTAWGAPRLRVDAIRVLGHGTASSLKLRDQPGASIEWRLVEVRGTLAEVHRSGDRWAAELVEGSRRIALTGLAGSGIPVERLVEGRPATVTGIVKRAYPTATDQRFSVVPRSTRDVVVAGTPGGSAGGTDTAPSSGAPASPTPDGSGRSPSTVDVALADLAANVGRVVRVGGRVVSVGTGSVRIEDGTAAATLVLEGEAAGSASLIQPGDTVNATGTPDDRDEIVLVVADPTDLVRLGDPGGQDVDPASDPGNPAASSGWTNAGLQSVFAADAAAALTRGTGRSPGAALLAGATLLLTALLTALLVAYRITRSKRATRARIKARLDALGAPPDGVRVPGSGALPGR
jgi:hypothetical protein